MVTDPESYSIMDAYSLFVEAPEISEEEVEADLGAAVDRLIDWMLPILRRRCVSAPHPAKDAERKQAA